MHPFVKILLLITTLLISNFLKQEMLWMLCIFISAVSLKLQAKIFIRMLTRMRWLFLSILIIYAFDTPGEYVSQFPVDFSPTFEGIQLGILQIAKLLIALASLSLLFASSAKEQIMTGLYLLLFPFKYLGLNVERFSARLLLTLNYVEELAVNNHGQYHFHQLNNLHLASENLLVEKELVMIIYPFNQLDKIILVAMIMSALAWVVLNLL